MRLKKVTIALLVCAVTISGLSACNKAEKTGSNDLAVVTTTDEYPIKTKEPVTIRWWMNLPPQITGYGTSMQETEFRKFLEEATGVKISFEHPVAGQESAAFNILQASESMPDIIEYGWSGYPGGPQKAIDDHVIISLNPYIDKVSPNLKKVFKENPDYAKQMITDSGNFYQYPFIRNDERLSAFMTFIIREDLLQKAGLEVPETLEEWENTLRAFKRMGVEVPISLRLDNNNLATFSPFTAPFGFAGTFYHDQNNKVKFGPYEPAFADWVKMLARWYQEGLLDKDFANGDLKRLGAMVSNGKNGAIYCTVGGEFGNWLSAISPESGIKYVATKIPTNKKGSIPMYAQKDFLIKDGAAISYTSKYKEIAARVLDYGYSEKGRMLYNFGKEGVSYEKKDGPRGKGIPTYTPLVTDKKQNGNLTMAQALSKYCRAYSTGPYIQDVEYIYQYYQYDVQKDALNKLESDTLKYKLPILSLEGGEMQRFSDIMTPVNTYREETLAKLISGKMPITELDNYFAKLKSLGIEEAIQIQQNAYNRFLNRKVPELD